MLAVCLALFWGMHLVAQSLQEKLNASLRGTHASAVVIDWPGGTTLASFGQPQRATPGSSMKPVLLAYALKHRVVQPNMQVYCRRDLHIAGHAFPCTHPPDQPVFTARSALAESCNTWFAEMARRFTDSQLEDAFGEANLSHTHIEGMEARELAALGLRGVTATPIELARAYRRMLLDPSLSNVVTQGMRDSVTFGMSNPAYVNGVDLLGKTGTASNPGEAWTHGWFAGVLPGRMIFVVYVPHGDGGTAAALAKGFVQRVAAR